MFAAKAVAPFLRKTFEIVEDNSTDDIVSWEGHGLSFVVWRPAEFATQVLPLHFKHNNFSSFVRQLNTYGFRKVDPDRWEFANDHFRRHSKSLLASIVRRRPGTAGTPEQMSPSQQHGSGSGGSSSMQPAQSSSHLQLPEHMPLQPYSDDSRQPLLLTMHGSTPNHSYAQQHGMELSPAPPLDLTSSRDQQQQQEVLQHYLPMHVSSGPSQHGLQYWNSTPAQYDTYYSIPAQTLHPMQAMQTAAMLSGDQSCNHSSAFTAQLMLSPQQQQRHLQQHIITAGDTHMYASGSGYSCMAGASSGSMFATGMATSMPMHWDTAQPAIPQQQLLMQQQQQSQGRISTLQQQPSAWGSSQLVDSTPIMQVTQPPIAQHTQGAAGTDGSAPHPAAAPAAAADSEPTAMDLLANAAEAISAQPPAQQQHQQSQLQQHQQQGYSSRVPAGSTSSTTTSSSLPAEQQQAGAAARSAVTEASDQWAGTGSDSQGALNSSSGALEALGAAVGDGEEGAKAGKRSRSQLYAAHIIKQETQQDMRGVQGATAGCSGALTVPSRHGLLPPTGRSLGIMSDALGSSPTSGVTLSVLELARSVQQADPLRPGPSPRYLPCALALAPPQPHPASNGAAGGTPVYMADTSTLLAEMAGQLSRLTALASEVEGLKLENQQLRRSMDQLKRGQDSSTAQQQGQQQQGHTSLNIHAASHQGAATQAEDAQAAAPGLTAMQHCEVQPAEMPPSATHQPGAQGSVQQMLNRRQQEQSAVLALQTGVQAGVQMQTQAVSQAQQVLTAAGDVTRDLQSALHASDAAVRSAHARSAELEGRLRAQEAQSQAHQAMTAVLQARVVQLEQQLQGP